MIERKVKDHTLIVKPAPKALHGEHIAECAGFTFVNRFGESAEQLADRAEATILAQLNR